MGEIDLPKQVKELILGNVQIVGWGIIGCSECPFSSPSLDALGYTDINISNPDEGHYDCKLINKHKVWGENPDCEDKDWVGYFREYC